MGSGAACAWVLLCLTLLTPARGQGGEPFSGWSYPSQLRCPQLSLDKLLGVDAAAGPTADQASLISWQGLPTLPPGMFFVPPGTYRVGKDLTLEKPLVVEQGAVFDVAPGATLTIRHTLNAGPWQVFSGRGSVRFRPGAGLRLKPEWFGAKGDGATDDAAAINRAMQSANDSTIDVLFSADAVYAVGSTITKLQGMRVFSEPGATLKALLPGLTGMLYEPGGHLRPDLLPAFLGFATAIEYDDTGMVDSFAPSIGPAPGLPCLVGLRINADSCRFKFGVIKDCQTGVLVTSWTADRVVMQGLTVEGDAFLDTTGVSRQVYMFDAPKPNDPPKWDHGMYSLRSVQPHPRAAGFAVVRSNVAPQHQGLPFLTFEIGSLGRLPPRGKLLDARMWTSVVRVRPQAAFEDGQLDFSSSFSTAAGSFNSLHFEGSPAQWTQPLTLSTVPDALAAFKAANGLDNTPWQNALRVTTPGGAWRAGELRQLYLYHQLAFEGQQVYLTVPGWGSRCIAGKLAVTALTDNSKDGAQYEVVLNVVACRAFVGPVTIPVVIGAASA